jgi:hypothetical protein
MNKELDIAIFVNGKMHIEYNAIIAPVIGDTVAVDTNTFIKITGRILSVNKKTKLILVGNIAAPDDLN